MEPPADLDSIPRRALWEALSSKQACLRDISDAAWTSYLTGAGWHPPSGGAPLWTHPATGSWVSLEALRRWFAVERVAAAEGIPPEWLVARLLPRKP